MDRYFDDIRKPCKQAGGMLPSDVLMLIRADAANKLGCPVTDVSVLWLVDDALKLCDGNIAELRTLLTEVIKCQNDSVDQISLSRWCYVILSTRSLAQL